MVVDLVLFRLAFLLLPSNSFIKRRRTSVVGSAFGLLQRALFCTAFGAFSKFFCVYVCVLNPINKAFRLGFSFHYVGKHGKRSGIRCLVTRWRLAHHRRHLRMTFPGGAAVWHLTSGRIIQHYRSIWKVTKVPGPWSGWKPFRAKIYKKSLWWARERQTGPGLCTFCLPVEVLVWGLVSSLRWVNAYMLAFFRY